MCAEVGQVRVDVDAAGHLRLRLAPCYTLLAQVLLPSGWKSSRKEYTALGSRPDMFTFSTGDTLLPLVVTIISLVSSLKRSPSPLSFRPKHSSQLTLPGAAFSLPACSSLSTAQQMVHGVLQALPPLSVLGELILLPAPSPLPLKP